MKSSQVILNEHLNGVHIDDSNDAIVKAMESYSQQKISEKDKRIAELEEALKWALTNLDTHHVPSEYDLDMYAKADLLINSQSTLHGKQE